MVRDPRPPFEQRLLPAMRHLRTMLTMFAALVACKPDDSNIVRGKGLMVANLPAASEAKIYQAAVRGAFNVDESLSLLLDARFLPREIGLGAAGRMSGDVAAELRQIGL